LITELETIKRRL